MEVEELRIGCHVEDGLQRRCRVTELTCYTVGCDYGDDWCEIICDKVYPIPITPELLTELGFCKKIIDSDWSMLTKDVDSFSISVGIQNHVCKGVEIRDNDDKDAMFGWTSPCKYLHELESFYYHCIGKELIND